MKSTEPLSEDRELIRDLVENWAVWRDAGDWERFATVWHDDGFMMATWFQGPAAEFIRVSREGFERGVSILHFLGGTVDRSGRGAPRAIAQTKMTISQRAEVHGVECDVVCTGRFYDFLERRDGRWGIVLRQPIYEKDRLDPVDPAATLTPRRRAAERGFRSATATSRTCRRRSASRSSATCRAWSVRPSSACIAAARTGSPAASSAIR